MMRQLSHRDRLALSVLAGVVGLTLVYLMVIEPYRTSVDSLESKIVTRSRQAEEVKALVQDYAILRQRLDTIEASLAKNRNFSLFSFVEQLVDRIAGRENLVYMRPQPAVTQNGIKEEAVAIKLEKLRLDQLTRLLQRIENAEAPLQVKNLELKTRFDDASLLDGVLTIAAYGKVL